MLGRDSLLRFVRRKTRVEKYAGNKVFDKYSGQRRILTERMPEEISRKEANESRFESRLETGDRPSMHFHYATITRPPFIRAIRLYDYAPAPFMPRLHTLSLSLSSLLVISGISGCRASMRVTWTRMHPRIDCANVARRATDCYSGTSPVFSRTQPSD